MAIQFVPEHLRDKEIYIEALKNRYALEFVPEYLRHDRDLCLEAVKQDGYALEFVPEHLKDKEICLEAVKQNGRALELVPEHLKDKEICLKAVKQNGYDLEFVPEHLKDKEICLEAVKQNIVALEFVPENIKDKEFYLEAVKQKIVALRNVPENRKDKEICLIAVKENEWTLEFVPIIFFNDIKFLTYVKLMFRDKIKLDISENLLQVKDNFLWNIIEKQINDDNVKDFVQKYLQDDSKYSLTYKGENHTTTIKDSFIINEVLPIFNELKNRYNLDHPDILKFLVKWDLSSLSITEKSSNENIGFKLLDFEDIGSGCVSVGNEDIKLSDIIFSTNYDDICGFSLELISEDLVQDHEVDLSGSIIINSPTA